MLAIGVGLIATACGSSGGGGPAPAATKGSTTALPTGTKAAGQPVKIGLITAEGGSAVSLPTVRIGAQAAVSYANEHLGGIAGRPIQLDICKSHEDSASARNCANQMVEDKVAAVVIGTTAFGDTVNPVVTGAGIPYITVSGNGVSEFTGKDTFSLSGGFPAVLGSMAQYSKDHGIKSVALFVTDAPTPVSGSKLIGTPVFTKAGVKLDIVPVPPGTPDVTSQVTSALGKKPGAVGVVGDATTCTSVLKALQTIGASQPRLLIQPCVAQSVNQAAPGALDGALNFTVADIDSQDPEAVLYRSVMAAYAPSAEFDGYAVTGYQSTLGLVRGLAGMTGPVTPATVLARMAAAKNIVLPAAHGITFTCDSKAIPVFKAICGAQTLVGPLKGTKVTSYKVVGATALFGA